MDRGAGLTRMVKGQETSRHLDGIKVAFDLTEESSFEACRRSNSEPRRWSACSVSSAVGGEVVGTCD